MEARRRRKLRRLAAIPAIAVVATLLSGSWWNPLDWGDFVDGIIEDLGDGLVKLVNLAFNNPLTIVDAAEWQAAFGQAAKWGGVFAIVAVAMCAVEIVAGMIASDHGRVVRGWIWAILAWPLTAASLLIFTRLVNASDWLTAAILNSIDAPEVVAGSAVVTGATSAAGTALVAMLLGVSVFGTWWLSLIFVGLALLPVLGLVIVLGAVTFGQIALAGFAPIALMLVGFRGTRAMSQKWVQMAVALLLTKPIAAGIITLGCAVGTAGGADGVIMGIIAVTVAVGSPALAFSFVGFAGAQIGGALTAHAEKVKGITSSLTHAGANQGIAVLRNRLSGDAQRAAATASEGVTSGDGAADGAGARPRGRGGFAEAARAAFSGSTTAGPDGAKGSRRRGAAAGSAPDGGTAAGAAERSGQPGEAAGAVTGHVDPASTPGVRASGDTQGLAGSDGGGPGVEAPATEGTNGDDRGPTPSPWSPPNAAAGSGAAAPTASAPSSGTPGQSGVGARGANSTPAASGSAPSRGSGGPPSSTAPSVAPPTAASRSRTSAPTPQTPPAPPTRTTPPARPPAGDDGPGTSGPNPFGRRR